MTKILSFIINMTLLFLIGYSYYLNRVLMTRAVDDEVAILSLTNQISRTANDSCYSAVELVCFKVDCDIISIESLQEQICQVKRK